MYPESMQFLLTYLIPIGWVSFYPISGLLGIDSGQTYGLLASVITLLVGLIVLAVAGLWFNYGLNKYESAGN